jgi:hypothetical protein
MRWHDMGWATDDIAAAGAALAVLAGALLWRSARPSRRANRRMAAALALTIALVVTVSSCHTRNSHATERSTK